MTFQYNEAERSLLQSAQNCITSEPMVCGEGIQDRHLVTRLLDDSALPDVSVFGEHEHVASFLVYLDTEEKKEMLML